MSQFRSHLAPLLLCVFSLGLLGQSNQANGADVSAPKYWVYVGGTDGITALQFDTASATLTNRGIVSTAPANFFSIAPDERFLYGVAEFKDDATKHRSSEVFSAAIDRKTGSIKLLDREPSQGAGPCYVGLDPAGRHALVANYSSATVAAFPIDANGEIGQATSVVQQMGSSIDHGRQTHAYAHSINFDPAGRFAFAADLGADKLFSYRFDAANGTLTPNDPPFIATPPGSGPRHFAFDRAGKFCYLVTEMGGTLIVYHYDADKGAMKQIQICPLLPPEYKGKNTSAEVQLLSNGKFIYASNRLGTDFFTIFAVDATSGQLTLVGYQPTGGKTPRHFRIDPSGQFLIAANQDSDNIVLFRIDAATGKLAQVGQPITIKRPQCVKYVSIAD